MAKQTINNGDSGLVTRDAINENFTELYADDQLSDDYNYVETLPLTGFDFDTLTRNGIYALRGYFAPGTVLNGPEFFDVGRTISGQINVRISSSIKTFTVIVQSSSLSETWFKYTGSKWYLQDIYWTKNEYAGWAENTFITGDSIAHRIYAYTENYLESIIKADLTNYTVSGSNLANKPGDADGYNQHSFVTRSAADADNVIDITDFSVMFIHAGYNDYGDDIPLGSLNSTNDEEVAGAINIGVENYLTRNPQFNILFSNPCRNDYAESVNGAGLKLSDYSNHIKAVCENLSIPCLDLYNNCSINAYNYINVYPDQIHPSSDHISRIISPKVAKFITNRY